MNAVRLLPIFVFFGCAGPTSVRVDIDGPSDLRSLTIDVQLAIGKKVHRMLPADGPLNVPGALIISLPDVATQVSIALAAVSATGDPLAAATTVDSTPHSQTAVAVKLDGRGGDLGTESPDLSTGAPPDLTGSAPDLARCP
jgi:hypothetical protein